jgi:DNA-directed RNA polymerase alpha subunit
MILFYTKLEAYFEKLKRLSPEVQSIIFRQIDYQIHLLKGGHRVQGKTPEEKFWRDERPLSNFFRINGEFRQITLTDCAISSRLRNALVQMNCLKVEDLLRKAPAEIYVAANIGEKTLDELIQFLEYLINPAK